MQQDLDIEPQGPPARIPQIQTNHVVESETAAAIHLPKTGNTRLRFQDAPPVPCLISFHFIRDRRSRTPKGHFSLENIDELWQLIQACPSQQSSYSCHPGIVG